MIEANSTKFSIDISIPLGLVKALNEKYKKEGDQLKHY